MPCIRRRAALLLLVGALACATESETTDDGPGSAGDAETGTPFPVACSPDESPFQTADCVAALRDACLAHTDENACTTQPSLEFDGYTVRCGWANVLTFADATSCTVASEAGRCEATVDAVCLAPCTAFPGRLEIIDLCGPIGPWSVVESGPGEYFGTCTMNAQLPSPALCDCAPPTCDVE